MSAKAIFEYYIRELPVSYVGLKTDEFTEVKMRQNKREWMISIAVMIKLIS